MIGMGRNIIMNRNIFLRFGIIVITMLIIMMTTGCNMENNYSTETSSVITSTPGESFSVTSTVPVQDSKSSMSSEMDPPEIAQIKPLPYDGNYPPHEPYGKGIGAMPGRVVWAHDPDSVDLDGGGYWWETDNFDEAVILKMVNDSIASLGGMETAADGWNALFTSNKKSRGISGGYVKGEKIAIKANINGSAVFDDDTTGETNMSYTNPVLLYSRNLGKKEGIELVRIE